MITSVWNYRDGIDSEFEDPPSGPRDFEPVILLLDDFRLLAPSLTMVPAIQNKNIIYDFSFFLKV